MAVVSMGNLLEAGVHFGHQTKRWNPKMKQYIFTAREGIYIIDLQKTLKKIEEAHAFIKQAATNGGTFLFVGTKKQASTVTKEEAERANSFFINERWLGGTLTNFKTIRKSIHRMEEIEKMEENGVFEALTKKEIAKIKKEYDKLVLNLGGIRNMKKMPSVLIVVDPKKEENAIKEARKLNIPVIGIVDTNCDPDLVDLVIPGNDDAVRAVKVIIGVLANAIVEVNGGEMVDYITEVERPKKEYNNNKDNKNGFRKDYKGNNNYKGNNYNKDNNNRGPRRDFNNNNTTNTNITKEAPVKAVVKEEVKKVEKTVAVDYSEQTVTSLRELAKEKNVKGYSKMKKEELIEALNN